MKPRAREGRKPYAGRFEGIGDGWLRKDAAVE
jgi:hypothetical protein